MWLSINIVLEKGWRKPMALLPTKGKDQQQLAKKINERIF